MSATSSSRRSAPTIGRDEQVLARIIASCYSDPLRYVQLAFPWGQAGGPLEGHDGPDEWQRELLIEVGEWVKRGEPISGRWATATGHGTGKTTETAWLLLWFMSTRPDCAGVVTANTQAQLTSKTWRELSLWHQRAINKHWFEWTATRFQSVERPETWSISAIPWSESRPEAFAGLHAHDVIVVYDEASGIPDAIWEVSEGAMTTPGAFWFAFGNPTRNTGKFRSIFGAGRDRWHTRKVDSREAKMANQQEIAAWIEEHGEDSDFVRIRVRGEFPRAASDQFIPVDVAQAARERGYEPHIGEPRILTLDVARFGSNQSVASIRQGLKLYPQIKWRGLDLMQTVGRFVELIQQYAPAQILVDETGLGAGVVDRLKQLGHRVTGVNAGDKADDDRTYYNKRAEMWGRMREWLRTADIPDDNELFDDLIGPTYRFDHRMRLQLERKEEMARRGLASPDCGDSLSLGFAYTAGPIQYTQTDMMPDHEPDY
jgi:hypothetical protein